MKPRITKPQLSPLSRVTAVGGQPKVLPALTAALAALGLISISTAQAQLQTAGDLFVSIDATSLPDGLLTSIPNNGTLGGFFEARGGGDTVPNVGPVSGVRCIQFDGTDFMQLVADLGGPVQAPPDGLVGPDPTCSIEVWAYNPAVDGEETMVSWGKRGGPDGTNLSFGYGVDGRWGAVGHWGNPDIGWKDYGGAPAAKNWHYLVYTYDGTTSRVYADGLLANQEVLGAGVLNTAPNTAINLATQLEADGVTPTAALRGSLSLARVRIHDGTLNGDQIASNYNTEKSDFIATVAPRNLVALPVHRWSFNEPAATAASGATFKDSIGGADGAVRGAGARFTGSRLVVPGGSPASSAYGDLPNNLLSINSTNAPGPGSGQFSLEAWVKVTSGRTWSRIFDFGSTDVGAGVGGELTGPGGGGAGLDYLFYSAQRGDEVGVHRLEVRNEDPAGGGITTTDAPDLGIFNTDLHLVVTWDEASGQITAYENGTPVADMLVDDAMSDINDVNVWLGRSNYGGDQTMQGEFDEVRIYNRVLSAGEILGNFRAGPDTLNTGEQPVSIASSPVNTTGFDTYRVSFRVAVAGTPPVSLQWYRGGTAVAGATGSTYSFVTALADSGAAFSCVASNFAQGSPHVVTSSSATLTVVTQAVTLRHLYTFNELDGTTVHDSVGTAHGQIVGGGVLSTDGKLALNGVDSYVNLPNDMLMSYTSVTFEAWVQDDGSGGWARIFDFGNSAGGEDFPIGGAGNGGTTYVFLSQPSGFGNLRGAYTVTGGGAGEQLLQWSAGHALTVGSMHHVVWTSHGPAQTGRLFVDAVAIDTNENMSITPADLGPTQNDWLGRSQFNDALFKGSYDEFRIWEGALSPTQVAANSAAGPTLGLGLVRLTINRTELGDVKVAWPAFLGEYFLEGSPVLGAAASWQNVLEPRVQEGDDFTVTIPVDNGNRFFRLTQ